MVAATLRHIDWSTAKAKMEVGLISLHWDSLIERNFRKNALQSGIFL